MMDYDENRYLHKKWEQKWLKINNKGVGIKMSWVEKNRKINNRGGDYYSGLESINSDW